MVLALIILSQFTKFRLSSETVFVSFADPSDIHLSETAIEHLEGKERKSYIGYQL